MSNVYTKMLEVQSALAKEGIEKAQKNNHGNYYFRGIDDVQNALAPILSNVGLLVVPSVKNRHCARVETSGGKPTNHWTVEVDYRFIDPDATENGTFGLSFMGEAYDTSDKGLQKAITSAYKYMLFEVFCIPVQGTEDADTHQLEVEATAPLTEADRQQILGLCMQTNTDLQGFLTWLGFPSMNDVPASEGPRAISALNAKLAKMEREYAQEQADTNRTMEDIPDGQ